MKVGMGVKWKNSRKILQQEKNAREGCAGPMSSLAGALGRGLGSKDVALEGVGAVFRQSPGSTSDLHSVKILVLIGRQSRI